MPHTIFAFLSAIPSFLILSAVISKTRMTPVRLSALAVVCVLKVFNGKLKKFLIRKRSSISNTHGCTVPEFLPSTVSVRKVLSAGFSTPFFVGRKQPVPVARRNWDGLTKRFRLGFCFKLVSNGITFLGRTSCPAWIWYRLAAFD